MAAIRLQGIVVEVINILSFRIGETGGNVAYFGAQPITRIYKNGVAIYGPDADEG